MVKLYSPLTTISTVHGVYAFQEDIDTDALDRGVMQTSAATFSYIVTEGGN